MDPCRCHECLLIINGPETWSAGLAQFRKDLETGRVVHIANNPDGQPIYREV